MLKNVTWSRYFSNPRFAVSFLQPPDLKNLVFETPRTRFFSNSYSIYQSDSMSPFRSRNRSTVVSGSFFAPEKLSIWSLLRAKIVPKTNLKSNLFCDKFLEHFWLNFGSILSSFWPQMGSLGLPICLPGALFCSLCPPWALQGPILVYFGPF